MALSPTAAALIALVAGIWLAVALWAVLRARGQAAEAAAVLGENRRLAALLGAGAAMPLLIGTDGRIAGTERLAGALGLVAIPETWPDLAAPGGPWQSEDASALAAGIAAARAGDRFGLTARPEGSQRIFRIEGAPAPMGCGDGTVLLWFQDVTEAEGQAAVVRARLDRRSAALEALSRLIEVAPFPIWHRGPDLSLAMVNSAYVAAVEGDDAAAVVRQGVELIDESAGQSPRLDAARVRDQQEATHRTVPVTIAGERRMMRVVEVPLGNQGVAGYAIDVEDQEEARAELVRFVRAQRDMLDRLSAGVAQFGRDRSLIFFNQPFARLFELTAEFLADRPEFERVIDAMRDAGNLPEVRDFPVWKQERRDWFISGPGADEEEWLLPGGKHLRVVAQPLPDGGLLLIFEDRTEQIQLASARDTLLRVRSATFDNLFEAISVFSSDGRLSLWNNRFKELWGFEEAQLAAHPRVDTLTPHLAARLKRSNHAGLVRELVRSATQERKARSGRVALIDGREFEFAAVPLPDGAALFTMLDITDSRKVEAALRERTEALEEADRLKTAFVSNMSYELRTPLTSIGGFAEMLSAGYAGELPDLASDYVAAILDSVARLGALIDNVLDLTQSDMGSLLLAEDEVDLANLCEETAAAARDFAVKRKVALAVEIDPSVGIITGDLRRLGQALGNIVENALRYTDEDGRVLLRADGNAKEARLIVSDNGRGIAAADQARVFDRFTRTVDGRTQDAAAVGLGLPLARQFVEAHGGSIALESKVGQGTTVTIHLPRTADQQAAYAGEQGAADPA
ncbi:PAS-domain containing protein [Sphingosinicella sp. LHD-64]|uniref:sensor histidine kinase n=1 Tax=Sphingosinicella sp. LHD-64 TaxID=3072139 RepID=UPI00280FA64C|nr:PAS-domain containing protein [Sphingosinicella sp. LHD-64]MDQ8755153.1 PAS-domain containing protein [Sphingosinicella sp. LHD-64]